MEQPHNGALDVLTSALKKFSRSFLFHTFQCACSGAEHVAVDGLHELIL